MLCAMMCTTVAPVAHEIGDIAFARLDRRLIGGIAAGRSLRRPAEERHRPFDRQVEPNLRRTQYRLLKRDIVAVHKDQCAALVHPDCGELRRNAAPIRGALDFVD
jgi:hypothetical protein